MWVIEQGNYMGQIDVWDRGVQFGDGLFETMNVTAGVVANLDAHLLRLRSGLKVLSIHEPHQDVKELITQYLTTFVEKTRQAEGVLKIIVTRGSSARGYGFTSDILPNITAFYSPKPNYSQQAYKEGIDVTLCKTQCSVQAQLAGLKHLNRLENVLAKQELTDEFEGLMCNHLGLVIEGTMSNVFFERDNVLVTPKLNLSGIKGIIRSCVIDECKKQSINMLEQDVSLPLLDSFSMGFICNSVMGIIPIKNINEHVFSIGPITRLLQTRINNKENHE
jgi:4-amino-4-deoxychorismate lyase